MRTHVSSAIARLILRTLPGAVVFAGMASIASAQQATVVLNRPTSQVVWATVRGGSHANQNDQSLLATRSANNLEYNRRALLKFDTESTIPAGSTVTSARLTLTIKNGSADASRSIGAYQVTRSWTENEVTWNKRRAGENWTTAGGDLGTKIDDAVVSNKPGSKITFDVTPLVQAAVAGTLGSSRFTRVALVDLEASTHASYREYRLPRDSDASARPVLTVTYDKGSKPPQDPKPPKEPKTSTLRVLHWNVHHGGVGSDGVFDPKRMAKWAASVKPDIISLNEVERFTGWGNIDEPAVIAGLIESYTGQTWYYRFATLTGASKGIGNMLLSRFRIDADDVLLLSHDRSAIGATINVNGRTINIASAHLHPDSESYRLQEIGELTSWARGFAEQRIVMGDFNASYTHPEWRAMTQTYFDSWAEAQKDGTDIAYPGNPSGTTRNSRIDFIYYSRAASSLTLKSSQVFDTRDSKGVTPSDHKPLMSIFTVK
jgi:endonuclease/exonuclease/phosphatase family metal-dependent hydrolase